MTWTRFFDMHSGGRPKTAYAQIYIEAPEKQARALFEEIFDEDAYAVACTCCGENFSVIEGDSLESLSAYDRWDEQTVAEFIQRPDICVIYVTAGASWRSERPLEARSIYD